MIRSIAIAATLIAAIPAVAVAKPAVNNAKAAVTATTISAEAAANPNTRYCVKLELTGSHIPRKICNTRADWLARGVDPLNPTANR